MKKLILGFGLEERVAQCSFCGECHKECVKGIIPVSVSLREGKFTKHFDLDIDKYYTLPFIGQPYYHVPKDDVKWSYFYDENTPMITKTDDADICKDCIEQLAKLIK